MGYSQAADNLHCPLVQVIYGPGGVVIIDTGYYNDGYIVYLEG